MMRRFCQRGAHLAVASARKQLALRVFSTTPPVSDESDDDFKPRRFVKEPEDVQQAIRTMFQNDVSSHDIFVYMKGTPDMPMCGFSRQVVTILKNCGVSFSARNVLEDVELRETLKTVTEWPTFPQLYVKGEFVGGCDIVTEMYREGELQDLLQEHDLVPAAQETQTE
ncbi:MAG: hypothetical protein MHM6MM_008382 [Cercozoa sp. M6MM]